MNNSTKNSLNYVLNTSLRKIFGTKSTYVVKDCMPMFTCQKAEDAIFCNRKRKFFFNDYASLIDNFFI